MKPAAALLCLASLPALAQAPDEFSYALPIEGTGNEAFYRLVIPQPVYESAAHGDLRDLRVSNGGGEAVPHAFRTPEAALRKPEPVSLALFPLRGPRNARAEDLDLSVGRAGEKLSVRLSSRANRSGDTVLLGYLVDASSFKRPLSGLAVTWGSAGASQLTSVRLEASDDLRHWTTLADGSPLGGMSHGGQRLERNAIEFRAQRAKYLRLTWLDPDRAVAIAAVHGLQPEVVEQPERAWKEVVGTPDKDVPGDYLFDLGGRFPVDRIELRLPQENTVAPVQLLARRDPKDKWQGVGATVAYRIRQDGREIVSAPIAVDTAGYRYWLVRTDPKAGGIGSGVLSMRAGWTPREMIFAARGSGPFRLVYGHPSAEWSALAAETLVPGLRTDEAPRIALATTGAPQKLPGKPAGASRADVKKWALWAALFAGVAVLGWMAWRLSRQMNDAGDN